MDKDYYEERLTEDLSKKEEYKDMSDKDFYKMIKHKIKEMEFVKAIVIYVG